MASFLIKFPEKDAPSLVVLTGDRITVGRLPENTIQIVDRIMSAHHAELIMDNGHYRLHDLDSTNGTFVNGELVTDFHLRAACKVAFGTVECEFNPETIAATEGASIEALPTRSEVNTLRQANADLVAQVAALREELDALHKVRPMSGDEAALAVPKAEYERVTADRQALKEGQQRHQQEIARLKENLALLRRDRENLQKAWDITKAELNAYRPPAEPDASKPAPAPPAEAPAPAPQPILKPVHLARPLTAKPGGSTQNFVTKPPTPTAVPAPTVTAPRAVPTVKAAAPSAAMPTVKAAAVPAVQSGLRAVPKVTGIPAAPASARSTQKIDPTGSESPAPFKPLPKSSVKLGPSAARPVPVPTARPRLENPPPAE